MGPRRGDIFPGASVCDEDDCSDSFAGRLFLLASLVPLVRFVFLRVQVVQHGMGRHQKARRRRNLLALLLRIRNSARILFRWRIFPGVVRGFRLHFLAHVSSLHHFGQSHSRAGAERNAAAPLRRLRRRHQQNILLETTRASPWCACAIFSISVSTQSSSEPSSRRWRLHFRLLKPQAVSEAETLTWKDCFSRFLPPFYWTDQKLTWERRVGKCRRDTWTGFLP